MGENRESVISVKSASFKDEDVKFQLSYRFDFGTKEYNERFQKIQAFGVDPPNNTLVVTHEFETEEAAKQMAAKMLELQAGPFEEPLKLLKSAKAVGRTFVACFHPKEGFDEDMEEIKGFTTAIGDFAAVNQYFEFKLATSRSVKDIIQDPSKSPLTSALDAFCLKLNCSARKELPIKVSEYVATKVPPHEAEEAKLVGRAIAAFHHLTYNLELSPPKEDVMGEMKEGMVGMMSGLAKMLYGMAEQLGLASILKCGGSRINALFCITPLLSMEGNVFAPTVFETFETLAASGDQS